jgi:hypothetical protein
VLFRNHVFSYTWGIFCIKFHFNIMLRYQCRNFPTKLLYAFLFFSMCVIWPVRLILLDFVNRLLSSRTPGEETIKLCSTSTDQAGAMVNPYTRFFWEGGGLDPITPETLAILIWVIRGFPEWPYENSGLLDRSHHYRFLPNPFHFTIRALLSPWTLYILGSDNAAK